MSNDPFVNVYKPSMLDRLLDAKELRHGQTLLQLEESILRDLQDLLNSRRPPENQFISLPEASRTTANFGIMDFAHLELLSSAGRQAVLDHIRVVIETYEPRLSSVEVIERRGEELEKMAKRDYHKGAIYLQVKANLKGNPGPEVSFETILELAKGAHTVKKELS